MSALRLARAYTGRDKLLKFDLHFHGWHDSVVGARHGESDHPRAVGVPEAASSNTISVPQNDIGLVESRLAEGDVAAVILEPVQGEGGIHLADDEYLRKLRQRCDETGALLIFDEIQTGFCRTGKFWANEHSGVVPDIMIAAKSIVPTQPWWQAAAARRASPGPISRQFVARFLRIVPLSILHLQHRWSSAHGGSAPSRRASPRNGRAGHVRRCGLTANADCGLHAPWPAWAVAARSRTGWRGVVDEGVD